MRVSVIIPHYNDLAALDRCLSALGAQSLPRDQFEIIVADNGSPCGIEAVRTTIGGRATSILCSERGAGPARNAAVAVSGGEYLAFIDSDCVADRRWLENGLQALNAFDIVGGRVVVVVDDPAAMTWTEAFEAVFAFNFESYIKKKGFTGAGNMLCARKVFDAVGGFKTGVSEDVEWSHRATAQHFRLGYAPKVIVGHPARRNWTDLREKWFRVNTETFELHRQNGRSPFRWFVRCLALPFSAVAHTPRVFASDQLPHLRDRLSALGMLYVSRVWRACDCLSLLVHGGRP